MQFTQRRVRNACTVALVAAAASLTISDALAGAAAPPAANPPADHAAATPRPASTRLGSPAARILGAARPAALPARLPSTPRIRHGAPTHPAASHRAASHAAASHPAATHAGAGAAGPGIAALTASTEHGILPPSNPPANIPPDPSLVGPCSGGGSIDDSGSCIAAALSAVDHARATEPLGPMGVSVAALQHLTVPEQIFAITDLERVARGLPPIADLTSQLDSVAAAGAAGDTDPLLGGASPAGTGFFESWGSNWAGGTYDALASDYYWMYDDGYGSGNLACTTPTSKGCWGHRDNILGTYLFSGVCGGATALVMGAAATSSPSGGVAPSFAEILAGQCGKPAGVVFTWAQVLQVIDPVLPPRVIGMAPTRDGGGYWIADSAGRVWHYGDAASLGDLSGHHLAAPIVGIAADPGGGGFWLVASDGGIFGFGAPFLGSEGAAHLNEPIVGITPTPNGHGYWLVAADGGIFAFGNARFHGSMGNHHLNAPIVGMAADPRTGGYWMVAGDGGIFAFDAPFLGSEGGRHLNGRIVGMSVADGGYGYRFVAQDGGIFSFRAPFFGSEGGAHLNQPITGMAADRATGGYWLVATDGGLFAFDAPFRGSPA